MDNNLNIPDGFELDEEATATELPEGFEIEEQTTAELPEGFEVEETEKIEPLEQNKEDSKPFLKNASLSQYDKPNVMDNIQNFFKFATEVPVTAFMEQDKNNTAAELRTKGIFLRMEGKDLTGSEKDLIKKLDNPYSDGKFTEANNYGIYSRFKQTEDGRYYEEGSPVVFAEKAGNFIKKYYAEQAKQNAILWGIAKEGGIGAVVGGVAGAVTLPFGVFASTRDPKLALQSVPASFKAGASLTARAAVAKKSFEYETGFMRQELEQINQEITEQAKDPLTDTEMDLLSVGVGSVNSILEVAGLSWTLKAIPNGDLILKQLGAEGMQSLAKDVTFRNAFRAFRADLLAAGIEEGSTEMIQESVNFVAGNLARKMRDVAPKPLADKINDIMFSGLLGFGGSFFIGGAGTTAQVTNVKIKQGMEERQAKAEANRMTTDEKLAYIDENIDSLAEIETIKAEKTLQNLIHQEVANLYSQELQTQGVDSEYAKNVSQIVQKINDVLIDKYGEQGEEAIRRANLKIAIEKSSQLQQEQEEKFMKEVEPDIGKRDLQTFSPDELLTDAKTFQYKENADSQGVTARLLDVKKFDPLFAGKIIVYESKDGQKYVVDGHQRLGLAKRLNDPSIKLEGYVFKEADGYTPAQVRLLAAQKNIAEGSGTSIDTAKIIKEIGIENMPDSIPKTSSLYREGQALARLGDEAFNKVVNEVIPMNYGAKVAEAIRDDEVKQSLAIDIINKGIREGKIKNLDMAYGVASQLASTDTTVAEQTSLFGTQVINESLIYEKAEIVDRTIKQLKSDKASFSASIRNKARLEKVGENKIDAETNENIVVEAGLAIEIIEKLAYRTGEISDKANELARRYKDGEINLQRAVNEFRNFVTSPEILKQVTGYAKKEVETNTKIIDKAIQENIKEKQQENKIEDYTNIEDRKTQSLVRGAITFYMDKQDYESTKKVAIPLTEALEKGFLPEYLKELNKIVGVNRDLSNYEYIEGYLDGNKVYCIVEKGKSYVSGYTWIEKDGELIEVSLMNRNFTFDNVPQKTITKLEKRSNGILSEPVIKSLFNMGKTTEEIAFIIENLKDGNGDIFQEAINEELSKNNIVENDSTKTKNETEDVLGYKPTNMMKYANEVISMISDDKLPSIDEAYKYYDLGLGFLRDYIEEARSANESYKRHIKEIDEEKAKKLSKVKKEAKKAEIEEKFQKDGYDYAKEVLENSRKEIIRRIKRDLADDTNSKFWNDEDRTKLANINQGNLLANIEPAKDSLFTPEEFYQKGLYQPAYHGSPYNFDRFSTEHIGEGEGYQAHGWGLYFTLGKNIAEGYRDRLSKAKYYYDGELLVRYSPYPPALVDKIHMYGKEKVLESLENEKKDIEKFIEDMENSRSEADRELSKLTGTPHYYLEEGKIRRLEMSIDFVKDFDEKKLKIEGNKGQVYKTEIPDDEVLLDEELPFSAQPEDVQLGLLRLSWKLSEKVGVENNELQDLIISNGNGRRLYVALDNTLYKHDKPNYEGHKTTSLLLDKYGIKGITYDGELDGISFVIFDDKNVNITNKFYQSVFHGTPHDFDQFDTSFMGSGEGEKVHGWGVYTAKNKNIADERYRKRLTLSKIFDELYDNDVDTLDDLSDIYTLKFTPKVRDFLQALKKDDFLGFDTIYQALDTVFGKDFENFDPSPELVESKNNLGQVFELDIPEDDVMLDEQQYYEAQTPYVRKGIENSYKEAKDKIVSERTEFVQGSYMYLTATKEEQNNGEWRSPERLEKNKKELEKIADLAKKFFDGTLTEKEADYVRNSIGFKDNAYMLNKEKALLDYGYNERTGKEIYKNLSELLQSDKEASLLLDRNGISGISYEGGTDGRAYVIFDTKNIDVVKKFYQSAKTEQKNLIMTHAAKIDKLDDILDSGALVAPSLAITKKGSQNIGFGDVVFVRDPSKIDFANDNIYDRDIYSPRLPQADYQTKDKVFVSAYEYESMVRMAKNNPERFEKNYGESFEEYFDGATKVLNLGFTPSGRRKLVPYNNQNLLNYIKKEGLLGGEHWDYGLSSLLAKLSNKQKDLTELKANSEQGLAKPSPELKEQWDKIKEEYENLQNEIEPYYTNEYEYLFETFSAIAYGIVKNKKTMLKDYIDVDKVPEKVIKDIKDFVAKAQKLPRSYFEAKPMREVNLKEFSTVLVPESDITQEQKDRLTAKGLKVIEYKDGKLDDVLNSLSTKQPQVFFQSQQQPKATDTPQFKYWFDDSKVVDEDGEPIRLYHGSVNTFEIFDKEKASPEGDMGSGFYFTNNEYDADDNYHGGGPDFDIKVSRRAEQIESESETITYEEAKEIARKELMGEPHQYEVYLKMKNPCYVGENETILFSDIEENIDDEDLDIDRDDFDSDEEYEEALDEARYEAKDEALAEILNDVENSVVEIMPEYNFNDTINKFREIINEAAHEGGITLEYLKKRLDDEYFEGENGEYIANELARRTVEALGYDGIIDSTVSEKFNMNIPSDTKHYIVFEPTQIKEVSNQGTFNPNEPNIYLQSAYNGSPSKFERFSTDFIGTGEGVQAHGYGIYFALERLVSEGYRQRLAKTVVNLNGTDLVMNSGNKYVNKETKKVHFEEHKYDDILDTISTLYSIKGSIENAVSFLTEEKHRLEEEKHIESSKELYDYYSDVLDFIGKNDIDIIGIEGQLYKVDIPEIDVMLDEQKTFKEQPEKVKEALEKLFNDLSPLEKQKFEEKTDVKNFKKTTGRKIYQGLAYAKYATTSENGSKLASELLNMYGIEGITYDGRQDGRCFVVFDDKAIRILETYYQFAGQESATANNDSLSEAKELYSKGANNSVIYDKTGWFLGADNKWRYEISDDEAKITELYTKVIENNKFYEEYSKESDRLYEQEVSVSEELDKVISEMETLHTIMVSKSSTKEEIEKAQKEFKPLETQSNELKKRLEQIKKDIEDNIANTNKKFHHLGAMSLRITLSDILDHEKLYNAYPSAATIQIDITSLPLGLAGTYNDKSETITLSDKLTPEEVKKTLMHEIQHYIQAREGFATGGSIYTVDEVLESAIKKYNESEQGKNRTNLLTKLSETTKESHILGVAYQVLSTLDKEENMFKSWWWNKHGSWYVPRKTRKKEYRAFMNEWTEKFLNGVVQEMEQNGTYDEYMKYIGMGLDEVKRLYRNIHSKEMYIWNKIPKDVTSILEGALKQIKESDNKISEDEARYEAYKRLAGEVEARNTEKRIDLTEEERKQIKYTETQDVPTSDQLVVFSDGVTVPYSASMNEQEYNPKRTVNPNAPRGMFQIGDDGSAIISVLENGDASTIVHELGHYYLYLLEQIAPENKRAEADLKAIYDYQGRVEGQVYSQEELIEFHERFARSFEAYLLNGKAPTEKMKGVFERFKEWLKGVYNSLKDLNVEFSEDTEKLFDRLFTTDEEYEKEVLPKYQSNYLLSKEIEEQQNNPLYRLQNFGRNALHGVSEWYDKLFIPLETSLRKISPELARKLRNHTATLALVQGKDLKVAEKFFRKVVEMKKQNEEDYYLLDLALKNRDSYMVNKLANQYGFVDEFEAVREMLDDIRDEALEVGIDVGYLENYYPRKVKRDMLDKFLQYLDALKHKEKIDIAKHILSPDDAKVSAVFEDMKREKGYEFWSKEDQIKYINSKLRGFGQNNILLNRNGSLKKNRNIEELDAQFNQFYEPMEVALIEYLANSRKVIESRKFFGNENREVGKLRSTIKRKKATLNEVKDRTPSQAKYKELDRLKYELAPLKVKLESLQKQTDKDEETQLYQERLEKQVKFLTDQIKWVEEANPYLIKGVVIKRLKEEISEKAEEINKILGDKQHLEDSIGQLVQTLAENGDIFAKDERRIRDLLVARFNSHSMSDPARILRDMTYITTLNDFVNTLTQFGDLAFSVYKYGWANTFKGITRPFDITKEDLGINDMANEFTNPTALSKWIQKQFKWIGLDKIDGLGKNTLIQASILEAQKKIKKNDKAFDEKLARMFAPEDIEQVKKDLLAGKLTDNTIIFTFNELADIQPISEDSNTELYNTSDFMRLFYTLKTYGIKALDIARTDITENIQAGIKTKNKELLVKGLKNLIRLQGLLWLFGVPIDALKDLLSNREFNLLETMIDTLIPAFIINRYAFRTAERQGVGAAVVDFFTPAIASKAEQSKNSYAVTNIPFIGKTIYNWGIK